MANMIMNVSGTVFQLIHYFPGKQGLAINLLWPARKNKQRFFELFDIISCIQWVFWGFFCDC